MRESAEGEKGKSAEKRKRGGEKTRRAGKQGGEKPAGQGGTGRKERYFQKEKKPFIFGKSCQKKANFCGKN